MYNYVGVGLLGLFILMIFPAGMDTIQEEGKFYGSAHLLVRDAAGNEVFSQTVHNRLLDLGENYIIAQAFQGGAADVIDANQIGAICVTDVTTIVEGSVAGDFSGVNNGLTGAPHCLIAAPSHPDTGITVLGAVTFTGGTNIGVDETIRSIAICGNNGGADYADCDASSSGLAIAAITTSAVQLGNTETVDITHTFELSSDLT